MIYNYTGSGPIAFSAKITDDKGVHQKFRKDIIRTGTWIKDGKPYTVDMSMLLHWEKTFKQMKQNGIGVYIPSTHTTDPEKNRGWVEDMFVEGDRLIMIADMIGEDGIAAAYRNDVSIYAPASFTDGNGITYDRPICHVALCVDPVVTGLGEFEPIVASMSNIKEHKMSVNWSKFKKFLGIEKDITDDNAEEILEEAFKGKELRAVEPEPIIASKSSDNAVLANLMRDNRMMKLDALAQAGKITPAVKDELVKQFVTDDKAIAFALESNGADAFAAVIAALDKNVAVIKPGEKTGEQNVELSRGPENVNPLTANAEARRAQYEKKST